MRANLFPVWLVARRELRDQLRDWRVLFPLIVLTLAFPFLMNAVAQQAVDFINQYGANLVIDRLVPFSILIIGFFPNTVSLVVALESFVGEKERGTIEPLLSSPLKDWQLYLGKLIIGVVTPLVGSYTSITLYLLMVSRLDLNMPDPATIAQLFVLTTAHAILMVSGAIVISVQSTSVKAANLLASFVIIPVALLLQGESVMLFWGNNDVLWLAVTGVIIVAALLIRLGIAHFQREYLLGREIDTLDLRWMWKVFLRSFVSGAHSLAGWYRSGVLPAMRRLALPMLLMAGAAIAGVWLGYDWVTVNVRTMIEHASPERLENISQGMRDTPTLAQMGASLTVPSLFVHNTRAVAVMLLAGLFSFSVLGILFFLLNMGLIGGVLALFALLGMSPVDLFFAGLFPHGIFEIPALMLGGAAVLRIGVVLVAPQAGKSMGEVMIDLLADWAKVFIGIIVPLLAVAAVVETYITPRLLCDMLNLGAECLK
jgi:uncharacterized membrane protein SpoIIM required for sporulation/ABC-type transport system involved in multi-copper enzyme maturation permease subunit